MSSPMQPTADARHPDLSEKPEPRDPEAAFQQATDARTFYWPASLGVLGTLALAACADGSGGTEGPGPSALVQVKATAPEQGTSVYRFAKISNGAYFYTGNRGEKDLVLRDYPDFRYEGIAFYQSATVGGVPVFRFANLGNGGYFYTASVAERDAVIQTRPDLRFEGTTFSVTSPDTAGALPVYRLANLQNGAYLYTTASAERDAAVTSGLWRAEGVAFHTENKAASFGTAETDQEAARFLLQAQLSASDPEISAVRTKGYSAWLDEQFNAPASLKAWDWLQVRGYDAVDQRALYDSGAYTVDFALAYQMVNAPDAVRKRVSLALSEFFVVSALVAQMPWTGLAMAHYWDQLNANAFGNFRQLLEDMTLNPTMGAWLNTRGNLKEDPRIGRVPDENYAREVMQLFTLGLTRLNTDGTPQYDGAGNLLPTYTQNDVSQLARVFTGYDWWDDGRRFPVPSNNTDRPYPEYTRRAMVLDANKHSTLAVNFLGTSIPANTDGATALRLALNTLFNHPNVGPFFARQMIQRLVTSNPSPAYVARVAARFNNNGAGVRGDLKAVWTALLLDDEARGPAGLTSTTFGKLREPMVRVFQWARTFGAESRSGLWQWGFNYVDPLTWFGQRPLWSPSVFNFFRPGYVPPGTALAATGATAPEFQIVNESSVSQWVNFIDELNLAAAIPEHAYGDIGISFVAEVALAADLPALLRRLNLVLCAGQLSAATQQRIVAILQLRGQPGGSDSSKRATVIAAVTLVMSCAEYLVQK